MTGYQAAIPAGATGRGTHRRLARHTWLVFQRAVGQALGEPVWLVITLGQPLMFLYLFGPLLRNSLRGVPPSQVFALYLPGLMVQLALFSSLTTCFNLISEMRSGVVERFRVTPVSGLSLLLGRTLRDAAVLLVQETLFILLAIPLGLHVDVAGLAVFTGVTALLSLALTPLSYTFALVLRSEAALGSLTNAMTLPLLLLSGIFIPMSYGPGWLQAISHADPVSYVVAGGRELFRGHLWNGTVAVSVLVPGVIAAMTLTVAGRLFQRPA